MVSEKERRKFSRVSEAAEISYSIMPRYKTERRLTRDLSLGGIRFISDSFIPLSSVLKVEIKLKHTQRIISAIVKVVWVRSVFGDESYEIGAKFLQIKNKDLEFLDYYLSRT